MRQKGFVLDSEDNIVASCMVQERGTATVKKAFRLAKGEAGFLLDVIATDGHPSYDRRVNVLGRRTSLVRVRLDGKLIPYGMGTILLNNRIEHYHSKLALKIRSMRGVKNLEKCGRFFQL